MNNISAQVSLYPLGQEDLRPAIHEALNIFQQNSLDVYPGSMSTLIVGNEEAIFTALQMTFRRASEQGRVIMSVTFSNACPIKEKDSNTITFKAIGYVQNTFSEPAAPDKIRESESQIILNPDLSDGLQGFEPGAQVAVIFHFHHSEGYELHQHPRGDQSRPKRGVFSLRSPRRPNPIGMTVVDLIEIKDNVLRVRGLDAINGTPVLDLKPV
jgi:tRNA-Thr(GGU) m(6)t(6)A37 methyltransferase TsaA